MLVFRGYRQRMWMSAKNTEIAKIEEKRSKLKE